ncbi:hypothetical protein KY285_005170 [Solanum tuberosum]|nr:hypothetical protein KY284_005399 [Solanum tuberosum]KAH0752022.1 hypothetical protein KY285_005170 [Solanum tuberosum]
MDSGVGRVGGESFTSFNEIESPAEPSSPPSEHFNPSSQPSNPLSEPSNTSSQPSNPLGEPSNSSYEPSNPAAEPSNLSVKSSDDESDKRSEVYSSEESLDSDVHEEYRYFRASRRHFNRSNRRTRGTTTEQIHTTEKGPDIGYDETNVGSKDSLLGKLGGDEP